MHPKFWTLYESRHLTVTVFCTVQQDDRIHMYHMYHQGFCRYSVVMNTLMHSLNRKLLLAGSYIKSLWHRMARIDISSFHGHEKKFSIMPLCVSYFTYHETYFRSNSHGLSKGLWSSWNVDLAILDRYAEAFPLMNHGDTAYLT